MRSVFSQQPTTNNIRDRPVLQFFNFDARRLAAAGPADFAVCVRPCGGVQAAQRRACGLRHDFFERELLADDPSKRKL